jgi:hypothetical protein
LTLQLPQLVGQNIAVDFADGTKQTRATVGFKGATAPLDELWAHLAGGVVQLPVDAAALPEGNRATLDLSQLIGAAHVDTGNVASPRIIDMGVSVDSVEPATVDVTITRLVEQELRVVFQPEGVQLGPSLKIEPSSVAVMIPQSIVARYEQTSPDAMYVEAQIRASQLANLPEGVAQTLTLNLKAGGVLGDLPAQHVKLSRNTVDVTFTILRQKDSLSLQLVPVWMVIPPTETRRYEVQLQEQSRVLRDAVLTGPRDLIERLRNKEEGLRVVATIELTGDMLDQGVTTVPLSSIEIQRVHDNYTQVVEVIPLNPEVLSPTAAAGTAAFVSPTISVTTSTPTVSFTVTKRSP